MPVYEFSVHTPLQYERTGKFKAPSPAWKHEIFPLKDYELIVMTEGCLYIADDNGQYKVTKGEHLLLVPTPGNIRYGYHTSDCSFYWLHFSCNHEIKQIPYISRTEPRFDTLYIPAQSTLTAPEKVVILMKQLQDSIRSGYDITFCNYTTTTILSEAHNQCTPQAGAILTDTKRQIYNDIKDYVKATLYKSIKVSEIAIYFGYNEKYLSHLFCNIEGLPLKQYILQEKMGLAKYMLTDTNDTINQISSLLCFSDSHNFMKAFKKIVGLTPTEYRNAFSKRLLYDK
ncbi:AraC family transcriptional regulator [Anaerocolumna cellulosilytica]|uniref:AraC family transcriptional regulator n=1 Tax=Anaerocolumna cellulosilytica TaxID=433286 RepID=A0A6S6QV45_9FIRM|nr:AraC family transcriptional regulator [Anaerocolumna cellulosilytica]MBB5196394.1 AraC-like DNA-binding protein [Anaerocolumna cellulosilytica]BCJ94484.1 AraC family transcriptional regulator [Anaerocolumna cellulosilytica]